MPRGSWQVVHELVMAGKSLCLRETSVGEVLFVIRVQILRHTYNLNGTELSERERER